MPHRLKKSNRILKRLLDMEPSLREELSLVTEPAGSELQQAGARASHLYFPAGGVMSMVIQLTSGDMAEVNAVGLEGMAGAPTLLGLKRDPHKVLLQVPGPVIRMPAAPVLRMQRDNHHIAALVRCYSVYLLRSAHQAVACNALHSVSQRAVRWILSTGDRTGEDEFTLTQESLALMLGAARQSVNNILVSLRQEELIEYARGRVRILDRKGLLAKSCECYSLMKQAYEEILG